MFNFVAGKVKLYLSILAISLPIVAFVYLVKDKSFDTSSSSKALSSALFVPLSLSSKSAVGVPYVPLTVNSHNDIVKLEDKTIYINNFPVKNGWLSSRYGMRKDPFNGKRKMHKGIDIAAKKGTSINPVGKGIVIFAGRKQGHGKTVEIQHGNTIVSRYSHLKKILTKKGQKVNMTDIIAQVGNTGRSTGPHLHLEIALNGKTVNPQIFLIDKVARR